MQRGVVAGLVHAVEGVQGPPGTGKSTTIFHIIRTKLAAGEVALATCVQNKAVDAIADKLAGRLPFLVEGNPERLGLVASHWTIAAQADRDGSVLALRAMAQRAEAWMKTAKRAIKAKEHSLAPGGAPRPVRVPRKGEKLVPAARRNGWALLWKRHLRQRYAGMYMLYRFLKEAHAKFAAAVELLRLWARHRVIRDARAVLCTVAATGSLRRNEELAPATSRITTAILDEAGTTPETKLPVLLMLPGLKQIIAIGDQRQLAPFSRVAEPRMCHAFRERGHCRFGARCKFEHGDAPVVRGFFQRLNEALPTGSVPMLLDQYRMHPAICGVVSALFYGGALRTPQAVAEQRQRADARGMWRVATRGAEQHPHPRSKSLENPSEVREVLRLYNAWLDGGELAGKRAMVITFYKAQFAALARAFAADGIAQGPHLRICTVDQSQGSEADLVILSTVRSNRAAQLGFLGNPNRLNVAISRARERLVVVGNPSTLCGDPRLRQVWERCHEAEGRSSASCRDAPPPYYA